VKAFVDLRLGGSIIKRQDRSRDGQHPSVAMPAVKTERAWQSVVEIRSKS
jgi:hypothetical protein